MNHGLASEVGYHRYIFKRFMCRVKAFFASDYEYTFPTGSKGRFRYQDAISKDLYLLDLDIDWGSELLLVDYLRSLDQKGSFIDVGANVGYYSVLIAPLVSHVYSFEPNREARRVLSQHQKINLNIEVIDQVVSDQDGEVFFNEAQETSISSVVDSEQKGKKHSCISLSRFFKERETTIAAIKFDIEDHDFQAIQGARDILTKDRPVVLTEFSVSNQNKVEDLERFCSEISYQIWVIIKNPQKKHLGKKNETWKRMNLDSLKNDWYKMLFLVPKENTFFNNITLNQ